MNARRERFGLGPMIYGVAAYSIVRSTEAEAKAELAVDYRCKRVCGGYKNYQQWLCGTQLEQGFPWKITPFRTEACGAG